MAELEPNTVADIRKATKKLLLRADALEVFPTPVDRIVEVAGLVRSNEWLQDEKLLKRVGPELRATMRGLGRRLRGTLYRPERVIFVDDSLDPNKKRFVALHETSHHVLPWQQGMEAFIDTDLTLSRQVRVAYEQEANRGAAELLFQLDTFTDMARQLPTALASAVELAETIGASKHSAIRRYVEGHDQALCVLVLGTNPVSDDPLRFKVRYPIESALWREVFGPGVFGRRVSVRTMPFLSSLVDPWAGDIDGTWQYPGRDGEIRSLLVESFTNGYDVFVLFRVPARDRFLARRRGVATIVRRPAARR